MKKFSLFFKAILCCAVLTFVSCGDDDDDDQNLNNTQQTDSTTDPGGSTDPNDIVGTWVLSPSSFYTYNGVSQPIDIKAAQQQSVSISGCDTVAFHADGTYSSGDYTNKYSISGNEISIITTVGDKDITLETNADLTEFIIWHSYDASTYGELDEMERELIEEAMAEMKKKLKYVINKQTFYIKDNQLHLVIDATMITDNSESFTDDYVDFLKSMGVTDEQIEQLRVVTTTVITHDIYDRR
ncbi:MAG: hypothetical protein J6Y78_05495 [Paludibacteraceae bacterium]|nr:hypothetical protein [Paludibacteraceae bacterium]